MSSPPDLHPVAPRAYRCQCGRPVFFGNTACLACGTPLGYVPEEAVLQPLQPSAQGDGSWQRFGETRPDAPRWARCDNFASAAACNWLVRLDAQGTAPRRCAACRLNRTIPDLSDAHNQLLWSRIETAKRRVVSQLMALGLPVATKMGEDPAHGLAFDLIRTLPGEAPVMTGHHGGVITIDIEEADDATRERVRAAMGEPYRTLLGHFRHELGHYYWERLVAGTAWLEPFRAQFGDERRDYAAALRANYEAGPPADWPRRFVSAYASSHPWEDWAETFAHYLHIVDTVDTALSFGIDPARLALDAEPYAARDLWRPDDAQGGAFLRRLQAWVSLAAVMNEMSRSMGQTDFYPFVLPHAAVAKLHFIHSVVRGNAAAAAPGR